MYIKRGINHTKKYKRISKYIMVLFQLSSFINTRHLYLFSD